MPRKTFRGCGAPLGRAHDLAALVARVRVAEVVRTRGLLDTSVVIGLDRVHSDALPGEVAISAVTLAELAAGPHATEDSTERARRQERLQRVEATFDPIAFDADAARAYGLVYAEVVAAGRKARGRRPGDLLIAAAAIAADLPLYTCTPADFEDVSSVLDAVAVDVDGT